MGAVARPAPDNSAEISIASSESMGQFRFPDVPGAPPAPEQPAPPAVEPEPSPPKDKPPATPRPKPRRLRRVLGVVLLLVGLCAVVFVVVTAVRLYPWLRGPSESREVIEARWAKLEALAKTEAVIGDDAALLDAAEAAAGFEPPHGVDKLPFLERDQLEHRHVEALDGFVAWHGKGGNYIGPKCGDLDSRRARASLKLYRLGQLSLLSAGGSDVAQVEAVLALALGQRQRGQLVDYAVGVALATQAAEWAQARGVTFGRNFEGYRPEIGEFRRAWARDAACVMRLLDAETAPVVMERKRLWSDEQPPFGIQRLERERLVYKQLHGRLMEQAVAAGDDHDKLVPLFEAADRDKPKSMLLLATGVYTNIAAKAVEGVKRYDELVPKQQ